MSLSGRLFSGIHLPDSASDVCIGAHRNLLAAPNPLPHLLVGVELPMSLPGSNQLLLRINTTSPTCSKHTAELTRTNSSMM
jgi:hypothetical protein